MGVDGVINVQKCYPCSTRSAMDFDDVIKQPTFPNLARPTHETRQMVSRPIIHRNKTYTHFNATNLA